MFGWWKKSEGFEWREYVRTTILVRRQRRKEKIGEAKDAAVEGLKAAGRAGAAASAAGLGAAGRGAREGAGMAFEGVVRGARGLAGGVGRRLAPARNSAGRGLGWLGHVLADPIVRAPALVFGLAATVLAGWRAFEADWHVTDDVVEAGAVVLVALGLLALPWLLSDIPGRWLGAMGARVPERLRPSRAVVGGGVGVVVLAAAGFGAWTWFGAEGGGSRATMGSAPPIAAERNGLAGQATALSGDTVRLAGVTLRLAGVEAPDRNQRCAAANGRPWTCGAAATDALARLVRARRITCEITERGSGGPSTGHCKFGQTDIASELVRGGHVFAAGGFFSSRYATIEGEAKGAKAGLWKGTAERPEDWRAKRWAEAKRAAPDGCPIKGRLTSSGRVYLLPWTADYERVRVSTKRGERWFCTETEAQAAGFRAAEQKS